MAKERNNGHWLFMREHTYSASKNGQTGYGWTRKDARDSLSKKLNRR